MRLPIVVAAAIYTLSWFLPVIEGGAVISDGVLPGWEAFRLTMTPIWPYEGTTNDTWHESILLVTSGLTNVWFLGSLMALAFFPGRYTREVLWGLVLATLVNSYWVMAHSAVLLIGYYAWFGSFMVLWLAAFGAVKQLRRAARS